MRSKQETRAEDNTIRIGTCQSGYLKSLVECGNADNRLEIIYAIWYSHNS